MHPPSSSSSAGDGSNGGCAGNLAKDHRADEEVGKRGAAHASSSATASPHLEEDVPYTGSRNSRAAPLPEPRSRAILTQLCLFMRKRGNRPYNEAAGLRPGPPDREMRRERHASAFTRRHQAFASAPVTKRDVAA